MSEPQPPADEQPEALPIEAEAQQAAASPPPPPPTPPVFAGDKSDLVAEVMRRNRGIPSFQAWAMTEADLTKLLEG